MNDVQHSSTTHLDCPRDDLPGYALGSLTPGEAARVEAHLAACAACRTVVDEYREVLGLLPRGLPVAAPSPASRDALLLRVREAQGHNQPLAPLRQRAVWWRRAALGLAAFVLLLAVSATTLLLRSGADDTSDDPGRLLAELRQRPGVQMLAMVGSQHAPAAVGQLVVDPGETRAALLVSGLPPLPRDHVYQFWFVEPDQTRVSGAVFTVDANGSAIVAVDAPQEFSRHWRCGVTEEPAGGSPGPTGRNVLAANYDAPPGEYNAP
jgi:anti-sigma-K factor RskA